MEKKKKSGKAISTLLIGTGIGAALGVLLAPAKGSKTRTEITSKAKDLVKRFKDKKAKE
jgi:gas vesicle protein